MARFTGTVANGRFDNDDGTPQQRLTTAALADGRPAWENHEIDLSTYEGQQIGVEGEWEHDWILEATIEER